MIPSLPKEDMDLGHRKDLLTKAKMTRVFYGASGKVTVAEFDAAIKALTERGFVGGSGTKGMVVTQAGYDFLR